MPLDLYDNGLMQYARSYILYLLGGVLLPDKANNTVHVRYLPLLADFDAIGTYSWGSDVLCWLYRSMCLATDYSVEGMAGCHTLLMSWIYYRLPFWAPDVTTAFSFPLATRWAGKKGKNDYAEQRLPRHRLRLDNLQVDEFGGKQGPPNPPLNIDTFHRQSARNDDGWSPVQLSEWFEVWGKRRTDAYRLRIDRPDTLRPSHDYYRWYSERTRRFLSTPDALHDPCGDVVPADAPAEYGRGPVINLPLAEAELMVMVTMGTMSNSCQNKTDPVLSHTSNTIFPERLLQSQGTTTARNLLDLQHPPSFFHSAVYAISE
ncbi:hypothetical protein Ahy_A10g049383 [Arachis hypogaea]|uniref:Aminotransferase-like plant mobile domain-containing protein n=1 Tax=Arachis hypogaea TaxID=3818 RepID=A0A445B723_ARAHY|nr:hypothetical protein Ahy_A10g049383 [Arachis hypogaea]